MKTLSAGDRQDTWDGTNYYTSAAADGDDMIHIDGFATGSTGDYIPTDEEKKYNLLQEKYYDALDDKRFARSELANLRIEMGDKIANMDLRNQALNEVVEGVFAQVRFRLEIYEKIVEAVDNYDGGFTVGFIVEDILKNINEEAKNFMTTSTSRRRINIPGDHKVTTKKQHSKIELAFDRFSIDTH